MKLDPAKASGPDNISARLLKELSSEIAPILTTIYRKQAADSSQATSATTRGHDASSFTDVSPDSNLNLLASSASSHVLNPGPGSSNPPPPCKEKAQRSTPTVTTTSSSGGGEQDGSSRPPADSSSLPTSVVTSSSLTELPGSTVNITVGSTENAVHSTTILVMPPDALSALSRTVAAASSSSEQGGAAAAAASASSSRRKRRTISSEKEAQRQYKVMYKYLKLASSAPKLMGVNSVIVPPAATSTSTTPTPAQSSLQSPGNASLPGDAGAMISTMTTTPKLTPLSGNVGTRITTTTTTTGKTMTPQPVVVPVSHTPSTRLPSVSLLGSGIAVKPPVRPSPAPHQGAVKTLPPPTVIFVSPQTPTSMASATVVSLPVGASGVRTKPPPHLLPAVGTSGTKAAVIRSSSSTALRLPVLTPGSWGVNSQATPSAQSVVTTAPCSSQSTFTPSPQPAINHAASTVVPSSGQSTSALDPQTGPCVSSVAAVTGQAVSTSLSGRSVSQSLVSTAKAGQTGHHAPANIPATATKDDEKGHSLSSTDGNTSSTAKGDATTTLALTQVTATSQGVHVNSQIPPATTTTTTTTTSTTIRNGIPRITDVPSPNPPQSSGLSAPLPPCMTSLPKHTQTPTVLSVPSLESSAQPTASLAAPTDGPTHPSTPPAAPEGGGGGGGGGGGSQLGEGESVTWDKACTLRLIQLYKEHQVYLTDPHYKKKSVWELMASKLRQSVTDSPPFRWNHVENKWKNMTKKFRDCVNVNRRVGSSSSSVTKCNFFDEIAAIYNYNPEEDKKKAAESPWTVKVVTNRHVPLPLSKNVGDGLTPGGDLSRSLGNVNARVENGSTQTDGCSSSSMAGPSAQIIDDVPLVKKKKYAHLDAQQASCSRPLASCTTHPPPPPPPPAEARERGGGRGADIAGLLQRLREDRARQESARMDRLESMHQEKMALFGRFLDILQQSKQKKG
ncbi:hypothetical protein ACOMHN_001982 [Nucella lapillus]